MLNSSNLCVFEGRMIADAKMSQITWNTQQGPKTQSKAEFTLAIDKKMTAAQKTAATQAGKPTADFPRFVVIGPKADFVQKWLGKGKPARVVGSFETSTWTDKAGQKQYGWTFSVEDVSFTISDSTGNSGGNTAGGNQQAPANNGGGYQPAASNGGGYDNFQQVDDGDMPF